MSQHPKKLYVGDPVCKRYDDAHTGPACDTRTGFAFMPGQIANWRWSTDFPANGPAAQGNAPFFQAQRSHNYCGSHLSRNRLS